MKCTRYRREQHHINISTTHWHLLDLLAGHLLEDFLLAAERLLEDSLLAAELARTRDLHQLVSDSLGRGPTDAASRDHHVMVLILVR